MKPIRDVAHDLGLHPDDVIPWGRDVAKVELAALTRPGARRGQQAG